MSRPTTKEDLIIAANKGYEKLWKLIDSMPEEIQQATFTFEDRDKNIKDVLVHLYEWHQLLLNWINNNLKGISTPFLPEPYNWKTYQTMNNEFWKKHQNTTYEQAKEMINNSHKEVVNLFSKFTNEELFAKKQFDWTGTTSVGSYCVSATSSHYDWAMKKLKQHLKSYKN